MSAAKAKKETATALRDAQWSVDVCEVQLETAVDADEVAYARRALRAALRRLHHAQRAYDAVRGG